MFSLTSSFHILLLRIFIRIYLNYSVLRLVHNQQPKSNCHAVTYINSAAIIAISSENLRRPTGSKTV